MIGTVGYLLRGATQFYWRIRSRIVFIARRVDWPENLRVLGPLGISALGKISIGQNVTIVSDSRFNRAGINHPTQLVAGSGAELIIGDDRNFRSVHLCDGKNQNRKPGLNRCKLPHLRY